MASGWVTSPWDQLRIFSGDARLIRMASKSAMVFCISNGLERNKVFLRFPALRPAASYQLPVASFYVPQWLRALALRNVPSKVVSPPAQLSAPHWQLTAGYWRLLFSVRCRAGRRFLLPGLDQLHVETERLQFAD